MKAVRFYPACESAKTPLRVPVTDVTGIDGKRGAGFASCRQPATRCEK